MHELQKLNPRHFIIMDLHISGMSAKAIAEKLEMSEMGVYTVVKSPQFQHEMAIRRERISKDVDENVAFDRGTEEAALNKLKENALAAAGKLVMDMSSMNPAISQKAALEVLDRTGISRVNKLDVTERSISVNINADDALAIKETLAMMKQAGAA